MKPINEIRFWLCAFSFLTLITIRWEEFPTGWAGLLYLVFMLVIGIWLGVHLTDLLIAFKRWWRE